MSLRGPSQLSAYIRANGNALSIKGRTFTVSGVSSDADISVATFNTGRASYTGVLCINAKIAGKPGAEVWSIVGGRKTQATFALHAGALFAVSLG